MKICHLKKTDEGYRRGKSRVQTLCAHTQPVPHSVKEQLWKVVLSMNEDDVTNVVRNERLILKLGEHLYNKHGHVCIKAALHVGVTHKKWTECGNYLINELLFIGSTCKKLIALYKGGANVRMMLE